MLRKLKLTFINWKYRDKYGKTPIGILNTIKTFGFKDTKRYKKLYPELKEFL